MFGVSFMETTEGRQGSRREAGLMPKLLLAKDWVKMERGVDALAKGTVTMSIMEKNSKSRWEYAAYAAIPPDGKRHEIIDGDHFVNPAPNLYHQEVSRHIQFQLYSQIELAGSGKVINAPVDLQLSNHDIVQPDLVVVTRERKQIMTPTKIKGVPDLVVEILSPSNPDHDLKTKRKLYEDAAIPEYWIVLPDEHQILQLVLLEGRYTESIETKSITMKVAPQASVDLTRVW
jgi:Uma2 family endonuclease